MIAPAWTRSGIPDTLVVLRAATHRLALEAVRGGADGASGEILIVITYGPCGDVEVKVAVSRLAKPLGVCPVLPEKLFYDVSPCRVMRVAFGRAAEIIAAGFERSGGEPIHGVPDLRRAKDMEPTG